MKNIICIIFGRIILGLLIFTSAHAVAKTIKIPIHLLNENSTAIGYITATDTRFGLLLAPNLHDLPPGLHGIHIHSNPSCAHTGEDAGAHFDPQNTLKHLGPYKETGHLGDLPALHVEQQGTSDLPILAPRLKVNDILGHALIIHQGRDNYSDTPQKLGGGGARIACGVIEK